MPHAFQWFSEKQRSRIPGLYVKYKRERIILEVRLANRVQCTKGHNIEYKKSGERTLVEYEQSNKDLLVDEHYVSVFCEDFRCFLMDQKKKLHRLSFFGSIPSLIYEFFTEVLEARREKLSVAAVRFDFTDIESSVEIIQLLNPEVLEHVTLELGDEQTVNFNGFLPLVQWNEGCRLHLEIHLNMVSMETLESLKAILQHSSTFERVIICYKEIIACDLGQFFTLNQLLEGESSSGHLLGFNLEGPEPVKSKNSKMPDWLGLKVLGNEVIMKSILENLECFHIQRLRKTAPIIRNCVDYIKPDPYIDTYEIGFGEVISTYIELRNHDSEMSFTSRDVIQRFTLLLQNQNYCLQELRLGSQDGKRLRSVEYLSKFYDRFEKALQSRAKPLRVKSLSMVTVNQEGILQILPHLDADYLENIHVFPYDQKYYEARQSVTLDQVCRLKQWKNAKHLIMHGLIISTPIQEMSICHFEKAVIRVETIATEDMNYLKKELIISTNLEKFQIQYVESTIDENLNVLMGEPYITNFTRTIWYFPMTKSERFLHIFQNKEGRTINFASVGRESVPAEVVLAIHGLLLLNINI